MQRSSEEIEVTTNNDLTLILIKPDMEERQLIGELMDRLKNVGLNVIYRGLIQFNLELIRLFYHWDAIKHPKEIGDYLCTKVMPFLIVRGNSAIPKTCAIKQELRKALVNNDPILNLMHCSNSPEEFKHEYDLILKQQNEKEREAMSEIKTTDP